MRKALPTMQDQCIPPSTQLALLPGMVPTPEPICTPRNRPDVWLWTARYQNRNIARYELTAVRITLGHPRFRLPYPITANMQELAPSRAMFGMTDVAEFEQAFRGKLDATGFEAIVNRLRSLHEASGRPVVLLCFEDLRKPGEWCHRTVLAAWLNEHGLPCVELAEP